MSKQEKINTALKELNNAINSENKLVLKPIFGRLLLCYEDGQPLPKQSKLSIRQSADELTYITVEFVIDNDYVSFDK